MSPRRAGRHPSPSATDQPLAHCAGDRGRHLGRLGGAQVVCQGLLGMFGSPDDGDGRTHGSVITGGVEGDVVGL